MDRQNTNEKKTLKKGRRGWVISAAIVALLGISAGTIVLQNQSSQNQGQCVNVTVSDSSSKEKEYTTTDTIKETEKSFLPKVDAKEELAKAFIATKEVGAEDSIKSLDKSYEKLSEITKVEENLESRVRTEGEEVEQVSRSEVANKDNKILEKSDNLTKKVEVEKQTSEKGKPVVQPELPSLVVTDDKGISAVQPKLPELIVEEKGAPEVQPTLPELVVNDKGTPEVQPALPEAKPEKDKVLDKKEEKKEVEVKPTTPTVPENKDQTSGGTSNKVVGETTKEEVVKPATPAKPAEEGKPSEAAKPKVKKTITTRTEVETSVIEPGVQHVPDANLNVGETQVIQEGVAGKTETTYTVTLEDDVVVSRVATGTQTTPAVDKVVHVGTKVAKKNIETVTRETHKVEHKVTSNTNPDLPKGEKKVIQAGKDGSYELVTTVVTTPDGTEVSRDEKRENEVSAVDEIVELGTGENVETSRTSRTVEVNYETEEVKDETLNEGKRVVETKGQKGSYTETTIVYGNGRSSVVKSDEVKPVKEVVRVGTHKVVTETKTRVERKEGANFSTVEETKNKLFNDQRVVKTPGRKGEIIENYKDYYEDGKLVKSELINTETVPAVDEVVEVGTKDRYTYSNEDKVITAEGEKRIADSNLFEGDETVEDAVNGKETYKVKYINDENQNRTEVSRELINTVPAKQKVVHYGTKKLMSEVTEEETETISHGARTENDSNLFEGETRTENGRDGFKRYRKTISVNNKTGERTVKSRELVETKDAVDTITYNGTKKKRVADPTDVVVPTNDDNYDIDGTWKDIKSLGENGLDPNNEDHRSAKYLHDNLSQADKDRVAVDETDDGDELPRDMGLVSVWKVSRLSQAELDKLEQIVDNRKLNEHFMELLNKERTRIGLTPATIAADDSELTRVANIRANEMADHGSLRYQGKEEGKHKRPDGSRWSTAYDPEFYKQTNAMTENAAETTIVWDIVSLTNEKALAHYFYTVWKHSPGHYAAMMMGDGYSPANKNVQFRVALGFANHSLTSDNPTNVVAMMEIASMMD